MKGPWKINLVLEKSLKKGFNFLYEPRSNSLQFDFIPDIECEIAVPGKLEEYLSQNCRSHYDQLVKNGCFIDRAMLDQYG